MKHKILLGALVAFAFVFTACQKETEPEPQHMEVYFQCKLDGKEYSRNGLYDVEINSRELSSGKFRNTIAWFVNSQNELFVIEILDSTAFREGVFDATDYPLFEGINFSLNYRDEQGWSGGVGTWNTDKAVLHITNIGPSSFEGTFYGTFDHGVEVTEGKFKIFTGI